MIRSKTPVLDIKEYCVDCKYLCKTQLRTDIKHSDSVVSKYRHELVK